MQTEPDVLTEHDELILSTSIERVVTGRDTALKRIEQLIQQLDAISRLTSEIGGGT
ncbi:TPA: restriction endonuclease subunit M, partial [Klebsiella pneumoniae]|nr:restriction endonuclease subunit M [Klebsiella pneumoniae]